MARRRITEAAGHHATTLILIGLILQAAQVGLFFLLAYFLYPPLGPGNLLMYLGFLGLVWLGLVYLYSYVPARAGNYARARGPTLVFAVLSVLTIGILSGLVYALAHHEMEPMPDAVVNPAIREGAPPLASAWKGCPGCRAPNPSTATFCNACGLLLK